MKKAYRGYIKFAGHPVEITATKNHKTAIGAIQRGRTVARHNTPCRLRVYCFDCDGNKELVHEEEA